MVRFNWLFIRGAQPAGRAQEGEDGAGSSARSGGTAEEPGLGGIATGGFSGML